MMLNKFRRKFAIALIAVANFIDACAMFVGGWKDDDLFDAIYTEDENGGHCAVCGSPVEEIDVGEWRCPNEGKPEHKDRFRLALDELRASLADSNDADFDPFGRRDDEPIHDPAICPYCEPLRRVWDNKSDDDAFNNL